MAVLYRSMINCRDCGVNLKAFLSIADVSLASSVVLSLEPRTKELNVRTESRSKF